jgi:hypothetical protein
MESALKGAILYGCESWLCDNVRAASQPFLTTQKLLLGVRPQTCTDLVTLEIGAGTAKSFIQSRQLDFLKKLKKKPYFLESPVCQAMKMTEEANSDMGRYIKRLQLTHGNPMKIELEVLKEKVMASDSSRRMTYVEFNPRLEVHPLYSIGKVPEYTRKAISRVRLGSHWLKVETGRWSRIDRERRLCQCGNIQTEEHMLLHCPHTAHLREVNTELDFSALSHLMTTSNVKNLALYCFNVLKQGDMINQRI